MLTKLLRYLPVFTVPFLKKKKLLLCVPVVVIRKVSVQVSNNFLVFTVSDGTPTIPRIIG